MFGAGEAGLQIITSMLRSGPFHPVAVLDDSPDLQNLRVRGIPVSGDRTDIEETARRTGATSIVIAIPSASGEVIRELAERADAGGPQDAGAALGGGAVRVLGQRGATSGP